MKRILVLGSGAQGSTVVRRLDLEPNVEQIIVADYNFASVEHLCGMIKKGIAEQVDASSEEAIVALAKKYDVEMIVNALPLVFAKNVLEAALKCKTHYQDFATGDNIVEDPNKERHDNWLAGIEYEYTHYREEFKKIGKLAVIGTGSAPGLMCVTAREAVKYVDECDTIYMCVYEGCESKRFLPFWWSTEVAIRDMNDDAYCWINDEVVRTPGFSHPFTREWPEMGRPVTLYDHSHDEPVYVGLNSKEFFKGCHNAFFKYGGGGIEFAKPLKEAGLISYEETDFNGAKFVPAKWVISKLPKAPSTPEEVKEILDEGLIEDAGAFVVELYGKKDGKPVKVETHVMAPGCQEAYELTGLSGEQYLTGQSGFLFTKLFVNGFMDQTGLISSDMLSDAQVDQYIKYAEELKITMETTVSPWWE